MPAASCSSASGGVVPHCRTEYTFPHFCESAARRCSLFGMLPLVWRRKRKFRLRYYPTVWPWLKETVLHHLSRKVPDFCYPPFFCAGKRQNFFGVFFHFQFALIQPTCKEIRGEFKRGKEKASCLLRPGADFAFCKRVPFPVVFQLWNWKSPVASNRAFGLIAEQYMFSKKEISNS